jgi:hypothetical protein
MISRSDAFLTYKVMHSHAIAGSSTGSIRPIMLEMRPIVRPAATSVLCAFVLFCPTQSAGQQTRDRVRPAALGPTGPRVLPGTRESAFIIIQGNALNANNGPLPDSIVRLRDARYGRIAGTQLTDKQGVFSFRMVDPGSYIVELINKDQAVVAASELLSVNSGETASAIVKMPYVVPPFGGVFGHTVQQAVAVLSAAAASGVLATNVTGVDASPR